METLPAPSSQLPACPCELQSRPEPPGNSWPVEENEGVVFCTSAPLSENRRARWWNWTLTCCFFHQQPSVNTRSGHVSCKLPCSLCRLVFLKPRRRKSPGFSLIAVYFQFFLFTVSSDVNNWGWLTCLDTRLPMMKSTTVWSDAENTANASDCSFNIDSGQCAHLESYDVFLHFGFQSISLFKLGHFLSCRHYLTAAFASNPAKL